MMAPSDFHIRGTFLGKLIPLNFAPKIFASDFRRCFTGLRGRAGLENVAKDLFFPPNPGLVGGPIEKCARKWAKTEKSSIHENRFFPKIRPQHPRISTPEAHVCNQKDCRESEDSIHTKSAVQNRSDKNFHLCHLMRSQIWPKSAQL